MKYSDAGHNMDTSNGLEAKEFICSHSGLKGSLHVGPSFVIFGDAAKENDKLSIDLQDIDAMTEEGTDGIRIVTITAEHHVFLSFQDRDATLKELTRAKGDAEKSEHEAGGRSKSILFLNSVPQSETKEDVVKAWEGLKSSKDKKFSKVVLENVNLPCDLDSFYLNFWSKDAIHPTSDYMRDVILDKDITVSDWEETDDNFTLTRTIRYMHPTNSKLGPAMARTTKDQELQRFGSCGMVLRTTTNVNDVPLADCFVLEDRIIVDTDGNGGLVVSAEVGIRFVKRTMWKSIIEKTSISGISKWFKGYGEYLSQSLK